MFNIGIKAPCMDCSDRFEACHDICKDFKEYRKKIDAMRSPYTEMDMYLGSVYTKALREKKRRSRY